MRKTIKAKIFRPTTAKRERLDYMYDQWNSCLDDYEDGMSYSERRKEYSLNSMLVQDVKRVESNEENVHPVYIRSQAFDVIETDNALAKWFARIPVDPYEHLWLPLKFAHEHEADLKESRIRDSYLCRKEDGFYLHINIELPSNTEIPAEPTFVGVDVGERNSLVSVALDNGSPTGSTFWSGGEYRRINKKYGDMRRRLQKREADRILEEVKGKQSRKLDNLRHKQSRELIRTAKQFNGPVIVMEDLTNIRENIDYGKDANRWLHVWAFRDLQQKIEYKAKEAGIPVVYVDPRNTSTKCHNCLHNGAKDEGRFACQNKYCPVTEYDRDLNAAINIAQRGAFRLCENADLGKNRYDDVQSDGARLTVLQPRAATSSTPAG